MWNVLNETVPSHVYAVTKQVLINRRDLCNELGLRSEKQRTPRYHHHNTYRTMKATRSRHG